MYGKRVGGIRKRLPDEIDEPVTQRYDMTAQSVVYFSMASDQRSRGEVRKMADDLVKQRFAAIGWCWRCKFDWRQRS